MEPLARKTSKARCRWRLECVNVYALGFLTNFTLSFTYLGGDATCSTKSSSCTSSRSGITGISARRDIPLIPDLEDVQEEDFVLQVASPPRYSVDPRFGRCAGGRFRAAGGVPSKVDIPLIPDLEDVQEEDFVLQVASPPRYSVDPRFGRCAGGRFRAAGGVPSKVDIPLIPDLEDVQEEDFVLQVASPPRYSVDPRFGRCAGGRFRAAGGVPSKVDIPLIPDLEDVQEEDFVLQVASPPSGTEFHPSPLLIFLAGDSYMCPDSFGRTVEHLFYILALSRLDIFTPPPTAPGPEGRRAFKTTSVPIASSANCLGYSSPHRLPFHFVTWPLRGIHGLLGLTPTIQIQVQQSSHMKEIWVELATPWSSSALMPQLSTAFTTVWKREYIWPRRLDYHSATSGQPQRTEEE
ncbi:hypothetical protein NN561_000369 [Cricetulus griseus]